MLEDLGGYKLLIIMLVAFVFFGAKKIPEIAQGLGKGLREFRKATREFGDQTDDAKSLSSSLGYQDEGTNCVHCNAKVARGAKFCPSCGQTLEPNRCPRCNTMNGVTNRFCSACGEELRHTYSLPSKSAAQSVG